jgi:LysR family transcriptional regulator, carnitine catabolism transcriptional activator
VFTLAEFRVLIAVAETGGVSSAAARVGRTPSAVSMTLKKIAGEAGGGLFEGERKSKLTPLGHILLEEARELVEHHERSCATIRAFSVTQVGRADVACVPSVAAAFLPAALARLNDAASGMQIQVRDMDSRAVVDAVSTGAVEIGFASFTGPVPGLKFIPLLTDRLDVVCRSHDPLARHAQPIEWRALATRPFLANGSYHSLRTPAFQALAARSTTHVRNIISLLAMVEAGIGITVLPRLCRPQAPLDVSFLPVSDDKAQRVVGLLARADRAYIPATRRLIEAMLDVIAERADELAYERL